VPPDGEEKGEEHDQNTGYYQPGVENVRNRRVAAYVSQVAKGIVIDVEPRRESNGGKDG